MCYVCRADIRTEGYKHFCQHFRQVPGTTCDVCESCDLYVQEDEAAVIKKAAEKAEAEYFRRFKKPEGWVYRRMENSVLGTGRCFFSPSRRVCGLICCDRVGCGRDFVG